MCGVKVSGFKFSACLVCCSFSFEGCFFWVEGVGFSSDSGFRFVTCKR